MKRADFLKAMVAVPAAWLVAGSAPKLVGYITAEDDEIHGRVAGVLLDGAPIEDVVELDDEQGWLVRLRLDQWTPGMGFPRERLTGRVRVVWGRPS